MDLHWVLFLPCVLLQHVACSSETVVQVNTKKWIYYVPERFLSVTVDPLALAAASPLTQESYNMAKGLSPSFVRIGGIGTNALYFGKKLGENSSTVTESQWDSVNEFARQTGLDIIASLNPTIQMRGVWDSQNSLELISYSNKMQYNVAWQLGYDLRGRNASGAEIGRDLVRLKKILDGFQNYANLPVFGPDISSVSGAKQIRFIKDMLTNAGAPLGAVILEPKFSNDLQMEDPHELISSMTSELDTYVWYKEMRLGKSIPKKPVWIAEPKASQGSFVEAVKLAKRVGCAARLGVQLYLRQAGVNTLRSPTPDFWFSLLYKTLVGQGVLDNKIEARNESRLHVFSHCTAAIPQEKSVLDTDWKYEKGAVTVFGVNESPRPSKLVLKVNSREEPLHIYILTADRLDNSPEQTAVTLLNGQALALSPSWDLPVLSPRVKKASKSSSVTIPGESIFFVVMPDSKVRTCSIPPLSAPDFSLSELTKRLRFGQQKRTESEEVEPEEEEASSGGVYVSFSKKKLPESEKMDVVGKTLMKTLISKLTPKKMDVTVDSMDKEEMPVRYITFNENSFLNKLAEGVKEELKDDATEEKEDPTVKYPALTAAIKSPKPDVISIVPLTTEKPVIKVTESKDDEDHARKRRASSEDPPVVTTEPSSTEEPMEMIKQISEFKKKGKAITGKMKDVVSNLGDVKVSFTPVSEDEADKARSARHAGGTVELEDDQDQDEGEKSELERTKEVEKESQAITSELVEVVKKTEKEEKVTENPVVQVLPPDTPDKNIDDLILKTAKEKSDPEPDSDVNDSKQPGPNPSIVNVPLTNKDETTQVVAQPSQPKSETPAPVVMRAILVPIPATQPSTDSQQTAEQPSVSQPITQVLPIAMNPMLVPEPRLSEMSGTKQNIQEMTPPPNVQPETNVVSVVVTPLAAVNPSPPAYNARKENAISKILNTVAKEEEAKIAKLTPEEAKQEEAKINHGLKQVLPVHLGNETILMSPEDIKTVVKAETHPAEEVQTLASATPELELPADAQPSIKIARQVDSKMSPEATAKPQTATLAAPAETPEPATTPAALAETPESATTPAGPVSLVGKPKPVKLPSSNQVPAIKAPTPEELRERFKTLREKMLELRSQYLEARDKRLEEFKKQVIVAKTPATGQVADPEAIKSTIKRREAELKEWFKRFDKREAELGAVVVPLVDKTTKPRPRRLSLFTNDEGLDMEKFFEDEPADSYNYKRSPVIDGPPRYQHLPQGSRQVQDTSPRKDAATDPVGKYLVTLDGQKHGILINNRVYPVKLFGYVGRADSERDDLRVEHLSSRPATDSYEVADSGKYSDDETASRYDTPRSRIAFVPKDAFIKEIKSDFIPVMIIPSDDSGSEAPAGLKRARRSTLSELEDKFHQVKDELFPKLTSYIKNLSENPPWKRDLERSSRTRRSIDDLLRNNDLMHLKALTGLHRRKPDIAEIETFVLDNLDKGENVLFTTAKKFANLAENVGGMGLSLKSSNKGDSQSNIGYCEEIGTSGKSQIRDPFQDNEDVPANKMDVKTDVDQPGSAAVEPSSSDSSSDGMAESMILSVLTDKLKSMLEKLRNLPLSGDLA